MNEHEFGAGQHPVNGKKIEVVVGRVLQNHDLPALAVAAAGALPGVAVGQPYPAKPIRLICPWPAGGATDAVMRAIAESVMQLIMEADVDGLIGAGRHERSGERATWRNGYRDRSLDTRVGTLNLKIPKLRTGSYFPGFLEPRKMVEKALVAVIQEAWIGGVSTRRVD